MSMTRQLGRVNLALGVYILLLVAAMVGYGVHWLIGVAETAQQNKIMLQDLKTPPLANPQLLGLSINGGPVVTDLSHTLFPHPCDKWLILRSLDALRQGQVEIAKAWVGGPLGILPDHSGSEPFTRGKNSMSPTVLVPSNEYRHQYVTYIIAVHMDGSLAGGTFMQPIKAYILDPGEKPPAPGVHPAPRNEPLANPKPGDPDYCPTTVAPLQSPLSRPLP